MKKANKILIFLFSIITVTGSFLAVLSTKNWQQVQKKAMAVGGTATISFLPASGNYSVSSAFPVAIWFNTNGTFISAISARIYYPYSGTTPEVSASNIQISPSLLNTGDWSCPVKTITPVNGTIQIDIACINVSTTGYSSAEDIFLGQFNLLIERNPSVNPITLSFDPAQTKITRKNDALDILGTLGTARYQVGNGPTTTPTSLPTSLPTPPLGNCPLKNSGDANCDGIVGLKDFFAWRREFLASLSGGTSTKQSDFNNDGRVNISDFFIWRRGFLR